MRKYEKQVENNLYKIEDFESVLELTKVNNSRKVTDVWINHNTSGERLKARIIREPRWYGVSSYEEAYKLLATGWAEGTENAKSLLKDIENGQKKKIQFTNEVEGFIPNVALSLMNVPNAMINTRTTSVKSKVIDIIYDNTANCGVSSSEMIKAGVNLVSFVTDLELSGYRCNVKVITTSCHDDKIEICAVLIKNANQTFNLKKMMFPLAHSSWLRVIGFDWQDKSPITTYDSGRGQAYGSWLKDERANRNDLREVYKNNSYILTYYDARDGKENIKKILKLK